MLKISRNLKKILLKNKGFTLVEVLLSLIILMLSTTIIIQCFNLGMANVIKQTRSSQAQLLCSALTSSLQNELTYARDIKLTREKLDTYYSSSRGMGENCRIVVNSGEIKIKSGDNEYPLVSSANYLATNRAGVNQGEYFLKAYLAEIKWIDDDNEKGFDVIIWVDDGSRVVPLTADEAEETALAYSHFRVKPLAPVRK